MRAWPSLVVVLLTLLPGVAPARPLYRQALIDLFGPDLPAKMRDCQTCHLPQAKDADEKDRPHNAFGTRLKALRATFRKEGKKNDITARLLAILDEDTDGDGVSNGIELFAGTALADPKDRPEGAKLTLAREKLAAWRSARKLAALWQPLEPVRRPAVPAGITRTRNPIDAFLAVAQQQHGLTPQREAAPAVLLRRVYLDVIGLPPTPEETRAFLDDTRPDAFERLVDHLLASPAYGERWGRHWMDVWRYSDWAGFGAEARDSKPHIWHWRDWIVESLNHNKPYDRMIQEMLAADELAPDDRDALRATGFLARNWYLFNRNVWLDRTVEHTGKAFLGITLNCARCHDHLYDPISQKDYFAFRALFEPHDVRTDRLPGEPSLQRDGLVRVYDARPAAPTYLFERGDEARPDRTKPIAPGVPAALGGTLRIAPVALPREAHQPERSEWIRKETMATAESAVRTARESATYAARLAVAAAVPTRGVAGLNGLAWAATVHRATEQSALAGRERELSEAQATALAAVLEAERLEDAGQQKTAPYAAAVRKAALAQRQVALVDARRRFESARLAAWLAAGTTRPAAVTNLEAARKSLTQAETTARGVLPAMYTPRAQVKYPESSTGRRLALARWITHRDNPLAARVAINHLWLRHFGKALVPSEFDFGRNGQAPALPALVDWLAAEFMDREWDMKAMHRLMLTSDAYRRDSAATAEMLAKDPGNRYFWRMNPRRMEGEVVRDSLLHLAGQLDARMGGPDIDHQLGLTVSRRSLYFRHAAEKQMTFLLLFDAPSVNECYRRSESIVPQQALALANSSLAIGMSRLLARQLSAKVGAARTSDRAFIRAGFARVLARPATAEEESTCLAFLDQQAERLAKPGTLVPFDTGTASVVAPAVEPHLRAREGLVHVLFNLHEFVTIR